MLCGVFRDDFAASFFDCERVFFVQLGRAPFIWVQICREAGLWVWFLRADVVFGWVLLVFVEGQMCLVVFSFSSSGSYVVSGWISSIGSGDGVVAMVQPIQAPMPRIATNAMKTGMATSQSLMASRAG